MNAVAAAVNVTTIHDLIYERFGSGLGRRIHIAQKRQSLAAADCIVCVSEHTRSDLYEYYPMTRQKRVLVIPNGVDPKTSGDEIEVVSEKVKVAVEDGNYFLYESPRLLRRLQTLRRWSHEQEIKSFFTRGPRTRCSLGARA